MQARIHVVKTLSESFHAIRLGKQTFEIRKNDRNYQAGDWIKLLEYNLENNTCTGSYIDANITYVTNYEQKSDYVVFSIQVYGFGYSEQEEIEKILAVDVERINYNKI